MRLQQLIVLLSQESKMRIFIVTKDVKENGIIVKQKIREGMLI